MEQLPYSTLVPGEVAHSILMIIGNEIFIIDKLDAYLERKIYGGCEKNAHELNETLFTYNVMNISSGGNILP